MRLRWLINNFADPGLKISPQQRREANRLVHKRHLRGRLLGYTVLIVAPPPFAAIWATGFFDDDLAAALTISQSNANLILLVLVLFFVWPWSAWLYGRLYTRPYRAALRDVGVRICIGCGYSLDGIEAPATCPECGQTEPSTTRPEQTKDTRRDPDQ